MLEPATKGLAGELEVIRPFDPPPTQNVTSTERIHVGLPTRDLDVSVRSPFIPIEERRLFARNTAVRMVASTFYELLGLSGSARSRSTAHHNFGTAALGGAHAIVELSF